MVETVYARKLDPSGRLVLPSKMREEFDLQIGEVYKFYLHEENGEKYLAIKLPNTESEIEKAMRLLQEKGYNVT